MRFEQFALAGVWFEFARYDTHRNARRTIDTAWSIRNALAAPEANFSERVIEFGGMLTAKFGKDFAFLLARQIRAWRRACDKETRKAKLRGHVTVQPLMLDLANSKDEYAADNAR